MEGCGRQHRRLLQLAQLVTSSSTTNRAVKLHEEVDAGAQCVYKRGYICRSPPPACQSSGWVPPPPPPWRGAEERLNRRRRLPGRNWVSFKVSSVIKKTSLIPSQVYLSRKLGGFSPGTSGQTSLPLFGGGVCSTCLPKIHIYNAVICLRRRLDRSTCR